MGKTKEKKFDRNVEISAPILDPEIIKAIHTPPKGKRLDIKGGFKALLSDFNSQDSTDEVLPLNDSHVPSYIGISCAVSGYSNYNSHSKRPNRAISAQASTRTNKTELATPDRSRATSPVTRHLEHQINHVTLDKSNILSADEERKTLTEKLTASVSERRRSPSPCIPPTEDDRHHGTYVGARYCPLPPPSKIVNTHIPLLGIDDEENPDEAGDEKSKVEQKIASLYGDEFVEDWRESMTHKAKKENPSELISDQSTLRSPKDLVTLKPTPVSSTDQKESQGPEEELPVPNVKVLGHVEKQFLARLLSDENPPRPSQALFVPDIGAKPSSSKNTETETSPSMGGERLPSPPASKGSPVIGSHQQDESSSQRSAIAPPVSSSSPPISPDSARSQSATEDETVKSTNENEDHIEYEIRAQSPLDNESSPVKTRKQELDYASSNDGILDAKQGLVSLIPEAQTESLSGEQSTTKALVGDDSHVVQEQSTTELSVASDSNNNGSFYLNLLEQEKSFIADQIERAERVLEIQEDELNENVVGRIRSAIGKANLLINKKCNQFKELCEANINKDANEQFATLNNDLAGFWDMLSIQVGDVRKSFETLWEEEENDWNVVDGETETQRDKGVSSSKGERMGGGAKPKLSAQKDQERREKLKEHINRMKQSHVVKPSEALKQEVSEPSEACGHVPETLAAEHEDKVGATAASLVEACTQDNDYNANQ